MAERRDTRSPGLIATCLWSEKAIRYNALMASPWMPVCDDDNLVWGRFLTDSARQTTLWYLLAAELRGRAGVSMLRPVTAPAGSIWRTVVHPLDPVDVGGKGGHQNSLYTSLKARQSSRRPYTWTGVPRLFYIWWNRQQAPGHPCCTVRRSGQIDLPTEMGGVNLEVARMKEMPNLF
jgi:hypothetical protein